MKIAPQPKSLEPKTQKLTKEEIAAKVKERFGKMAQSKAPTPKKDSVELNSKGVKSSDQENFGDVAKNDPTSEVTQEKLKMILQNGGFHFNDKERQALGQILK